MILRKQEDHNLNHMMKVNHNSNHLMMTQTMNRVPVEIFLPGGGYDFWDTFFCLFVCTLACWQNLRSGCDLLKMCEWVYFTEQYL